VCGYGNTAEDATMGYPQPSPKRLPGRMDAVHRLNGGGSASAGLRYSRAPPEMAGDSRVSPFRR